MPLSHSEETQVLQEVGIALRSQDFLHATRSMLYGGYFMLALTAMFSLWWDLPRNRGLDTVASRTLLAFMIAVFLMVTAGFVLGYLIDGEVIRAILIADDQPILQRVYGLPYVKRLAIIESIKVVIGFDPLSLILLCGDIMVVWRAGVLCRERRIIMMVPLALLLCAASLIIARLPFLLKPKEANNAAELNVSQITNFLMLSQLLCSFAANISATGIIGYHAYQHRRLMAEAASASKSKAGKIMLFLAESGAFYCSVQIVSLSLNIWSSSTPFLSTEGANARLVFSSFSDFQYFVSACYPSVITLIVTFNRSIANDTGVYSGGPGAKGPSEPFDAGTHISFAARPVRRRFSYADFMSSTLDGVIDLEDYGPSVEEKQLGITEHSSFEDVMHISDSEGLSNSAPTNNGRR